MHNSQGRHPSLCERLLDYEQQTYEVADKEGGSWQEDQQVLDGP